MRDSDDAGELMTLIPAGTKSLLLGSTVTLAFPSENDAILFNEVMIWYASGAREDA